MQLPRKSLNKMPEQSIGAKSFQQHDSRILFEGQKMLIYGLCSANLQ